MVTFSTVFLAICFRARVHFESHVSEAALLQHAVLNGGVFDIDTIELVYAEDLLEGYTSIDQDSDYHCAWCV